MSASELDYAVELPHKTIDERRHMGTTQLSENFSRIGKIPAQGPADAGLTLGADVGITENGHPRQIDSLGRMAATVCQFGMYLYRANRYICDKIIN